MTEETRNLFSKPRMWKLIKSWRLIKTLFHGLKLIKKLVQEIRKTILLCENFFFASFLLCLCYLILTHKWSCRFLWISSRQKLDQSDINHTLKSPCLFNHGIQLLPLWYNLLGLIPQIIWYCTQASVNIIQVSSSERQNRSEIPHCSWTDSWVSQFSVRLSNPTTYN